MGFFSIFVCTVLQRGTCAVDCFKLLTKKATHLHGFPLNGDLQRSRNTLGFVLFFNILKSTLKINYFGVEVVVLDAFSLEISRKSGHVFLSFVGRVEISDRCHELFKKRTHW